MGTLAGGYREQIRGVSGGVQDCEGVGEDNGGGDGGGVVGAEGARGVAGTLAGGAVGTAVGGVVPCGGTFHARTASLAAGARFFRNRPWAVVQERVLRTRRAAAAPRTSRTGSDTDRPAGHGDDLWGQ